MEKEIIFNGKKELVEMRALNISDVDESMETNPKSVRDLRWTQLLMTLTKVPEGFPKDVNGFKQLEWNDCGSVLDEMFTELNFVSKKNG